MQRPQTQRVCASPATIDRGRQLFDDVIPVQTGIHVAADACLRGHDGDGLVAWHPEMAAPLPVRQPALIRRALLTTGFTYASLLFGA